MNLPQHLKKSDKVWIVTPAKAIPDGGIENAIKILTHWGLTVELGKHVLGKSGGFGGTDEQRKNDLQFAINDKEAKAIFLSRGGYGSVRIIDDVSFESLIEHPKWLIGYSDITYFHLKLNQLKIPTIHGTMPLEINFEIERKEAIEKTKKLLFGELPSLYSTGNEFNIQGLLVGEIVGGNLNIVHGNLGNTPKNFWNDKILFLEDIGEEMYALDRMLFNLKRAEVFDRVQGFIFGGFSGIKDTNNWFPKTDINKLISEIIQPYQKPSAFNFPAGHIKNNWPIILGLQSKVEISKSETKISFLIG